MEFLASSGVFDSILNRMLANSNALPIVMFISAINESLVEAHLRAPLSIKGAVSNTGGAISTRALAVVT